MTSNHKYQKGVTLQVLGLNVGEAQALMI